MSVHAAAQPPEPVRIEVELESGRVTKGEFSEGISIDLTGTLRCSRRVNAMLSVKIVVESATAPVESGGIWECSSESHPWGLGMSASDPAFGTETPVATIVAQATDELNTDLAVGGPFIAEDRIDGVEIDPLGTPSPRVGEEAIGLEWLALVAAAALALTGWSFLLLRWSRTRRRLA